MIYSKLAAPSTWKAVGCLAGLDYKSTISFSLPFSERITSRVKQFKRLASLSLFSRDTLLKRVFTELNSVNVPHFVELTVSKRRFEL